MANNQSQVEIALAEKCHLCNNNLSNGYKLSSYTTGTGSIQISRNKKRIFMRRWPFRICNVQPAIILLILLFLFQFMLLFDPTAFFWDGVFYYSYTRSAILDGDLNIANDLRLSYDVTPAKDFVAKRLDQNLTATGHVDSPFALGTSILWLPWFGLIYACLSIAGHFGLASAGKTTGYEWPFVWGMATVTAVYGWLALLISYRLVRRFVRRAKALLAAVTVSMAIPLVYYQFREPFYAHAASALTVAWFVSLWWQQTEREEQQAAEAIVLGLLGGLAGLVRWQNIAYLSLPYLSILYGAWKAHKQDDRPVMKQALLHLALLSLAAFLVFSCQLVAWFRIYGQWFTIPQGSSFVDWRALWLRPVLFSSFHGVLTWAPVALLALLGLAFRARQYPRLVLPLLAAFALQVYINSSVSQWHGAGGYGSRRFSGTLIILVLGYALLLSSLWCTRYRLLGMVMSGLLIVHQWLLLRFGFPDQIGGRVLSMAPSFRWEETSLLAFFTQLFGYLPYAIEHPLEAIHFHNSPLFLVTSSPFTVISQGFLLGSVLLILWIGTMGWKQVSRYTSERSRGHLLSGSALVLPLVAIVWLYFHA